MPRKKPRKHQGNKPPKVEKKAPPPPYQTLLTNQLQTAERYLMHRALSSINESLASDLAQGEVEVRDALQLWPTWRSLRNTADAISEYRAECAAAPCARRRPPPPQLRLRADPSAFPALPMGRWARLQSQVPADVWRTIINFVVPTARRTLASRGLTVEETVAFAPAAGRLLTAGADRDFQCDDVDPCFHRLAALSGLRAVSTEWRDIVSYSSVQSLYVGSDWHLTSEIADRFGGCASLVIDGFGEDRRGEELYRMMYDRFPKELRRLPALRTLALQRMRVVELPPWFRTLQLVELSIDYPEDLADDLEARAWERDENALPRTLEVMRWSFFVANPQLACVRRLPRLRELCLATQTSQDSFIPHVVPDWFHELSSLRAIQMRADLTTVDDWLYEFERMGLTTLDLYDADAGFSVHQDHADVFSTDARLAGTPLAASLERLTVCGFTDLPRVPAVVPTLKSLRLLCLASVKLTEIPAAIGELPLVVLDCSYTCIADLPLSMHAMTTLRILDLEGTHLNGPERHEEDASGHDHTSDGGVVYIRTPDEDLMQGTHYFLDVMDPSREAAAAIEARNNVLRPLSLALPDLRLKLHATHAKGTWPFRGQAPPTMFWWHARCGVDWTDEAFY